ncbi:hypothetical protein OH76DRAFT_246815 [Lentinus brumalis]|uniref:Uncharacterized protein n=1 Tax=Lentinus brumalis TaxID=2498619 RepID=A0A371CLV5_9APHY|nr:hypothetical protein OH76DRAFT_246815 [Polyporus brumalis]
MSHRIGPVRRSPVEAGCVLSICLIHVFRPACSTLTSRRRSSLVTMRIAGRSRFEIFTLCFILLRDHLVLRPAVAS